MNNTIFPIPYNADYFYSLSLFIGAIVNLLLAGMLVFDSNNFLYRDAPRYLRSRYMTALSLAIFGVGFLVHWYFLPRICYPLAASALSVAYFHAGGVLFSMSHTGLIDAHYLTRRVVIRDVSITAIGLAVYALSVLFDNMLLLHLGFALFFVHLGLLAVIFYRHFHRVYAQLGNYAEEQPNDTDYEIRWLFFSCHLIILFGLGSVIITLLFPHDLIPFVLLMFVGISVFSYIYKALDSYGACVFDAEKNMQKSEAYLHTERGRRRFLQFLQRRARISFFTIFPLFSGFYKE